MTHTNPQLKIRLEPEVKAWVEGKAKDDDRSQAWVINHLAKEAMRREQSPMN